MKNFEDRLTELESKMAYHEHTVQQLNDIVVEQQNRLARLESSLAALSGRLLEISESIHATTGGEEKPPHY